MKMQTVMIDIGILFAALHVRKLIVYKDMLEGNVLF